MRRIPAHPELAVRDLWRSKPGRTWRTLAGASEVLLTYSGRGAIYQSFSALRHARNYGRRNVVLLPSFHCPTVVDPVLHAGFDVRFYAVHEDLSPITTSLLEQLDSSTAAVIFIRYFGIVETDENLTRAVREAGAVVIEDCSHSFLSEAPLRLAGRSADVATYSFWKIVPSLAGGGFCMTHRLRRSVSLPLLAKPDKKRTRALVLSAARQLLNPLMKLARDGGRVGVGRGIAQSSLTPALRRTAAEAYPYSCPESDWRMPTTSRAVLGMVDLADIARRRRENYTNLVGRIAAVSEMRPIRATLDGQACPWGLPVLLARRSERDYLLHAQGVPLFTFGEVLHPLLGSRQSASGASEDAAEHLSNNLLVLSIHQGIRRSQIERIGDLIDDML